VCKELGSRWLVTADHGNADADGPLGSTKRVSSASLDWDRPPAPGVAPSARMLSKAFNWPALRKSRDMPKAHSWRGTS